MKVLDFGLVKGDGARPASRRSLTAPESTTGTPAYMAPEMAAGEPVDGRPISTRSAAWATSC